MATIAKPNFEGWCTTDWKYKTHRFTWTIKNFSEYHTGQSLDSVAFTVHSVTCETQWKLVLYPQGFRQSDLSVYVILKCLKLSKPQVATKFEISTLDVDGVKHNTVSGRKKFYVTINTCGQWCRQGFVKRAYLSENCKIILPNDVMTICLELSILDDLKLTSGSDEFSIGIADELGIALINELFCDIMLVIGDREFPAHKFVLAARSPVFKAMLQTPMTEKANNVIHIVDIDAEVLQQMLWYMYTGRLPAMENIEMTAAILHAADKYLLLTLRRVCDMALTEMMTLKSVVRLLVLADKYDLKPLRDSCVEFAIEHVSVLTGTPEWNAFEESHGNIACRILRGALCKKVQRT